MLSYRCFLLDSSNHIVANDLIECETETEVQACADRLLAACGYPGIEVWDCGRQVYRARKNDAPSPARDDSLHCRGWVEHDQIQA